jgi:hypothetical protein
MRNKYQVGAVGKRVEIGNISSRPELTPNEALELAAYLVAVALPMMSGETDELLHQFMGKVADASDDPEVSKAVQEMG